MSAGPRKSVFDKQYVILYPAWRGDDRLVILLTYVYIEYITYRVCVYRTIAGVLCIQTGECTPVSSVLTGITVFGQCARIPFEVNLCCSDYGVVYAYIDQVELDIKMGFVDQIGATKYLSDVHTIVSNDLKVHEWNYFGTPAVTTFHTSDAWIFCEKQANMPTVMVGCKEDRIFLVYTMNENGIWHLLARNRNPIHNETIAHVIYHNHVLYILCNSRRFVVCDMAPANPVWATVETNLPDAFDFASGIHLCMSNNIIYACRIIRAHKQIRHNAVVIYKQAREADYTVWIETLPLILPVTISDDYMARMCDVDGILTFFVVSVDCILLATYRYDIHTNSWNLVE